MYRRRHLGDRLVSFRLHAVVVGRRARQGGDKHGLARRYGVPMHL
jgi:hypothetical protein